MGSRDKVIVHTKTGKKLVYYPTSPFEDLKYFWLNNGVYGEGAVSFGRFIVLKSEIAFVEILGK